MGCYHGKFSFDQLSHLRSCMVRPLKNEGMNGMRYPPHTLGKLGWARFFLVQAPDLGLMGRMGALAVLVALAGFLLHVSTLIPPCTRSGTRPQPRSWAGFLRTAPVNITAETI